MDLTSVPESSMPVSNFSSMKYSWYAFWFFATILTPVAATLAPPSIPCFLIISRLSSRHTPALEHSANFTKGLAGSRAACYNKTNVPERRRTLCRTGTFPCRYSRAATPTGQLQPLRFRFEDSEHQLHTVHITEIIDSRFVEYVGIETFVFLCKALLEGAEKLYELLLHRPHPPLDALSGGLLMAEPVWFHIDVNSAFLSWTAAYRTLVEGRSPDLRDIPAVIANDKNLRTSIVLAKSTPAEKIR